MTKIVQKNKDLTKNKNPEKSSIIEILYTLLFALVIAILFRSFFFEPFRIPSGSMYPTLRTGDFIIVSKFSYGYSKHSFPWSLPIVSNRILYSEPKRGDIAVFKLPQHDKRFFVKRIIGIPGDEIQMIRGQLHINGQPVERRFVGRLPEQLPGVPYWTLVNQYEETLPNSLHYTTWSLERVMDVREFPNTTEPYIIPDGKFFMMGDNRDNSSDSRELQEIGLVDKNNLLGKVSFIHFSTNDIKRSFSRVGAKST